MRRIVLIALLVILNGSCEKDDTPRSGTEVTGTVPLRDAGGILHESKASEAAIVSGEPASSRTTHDVDPTRSSCEQEHQLAMTRLDEVLAASRLCHWDVDCVMVSAETRCAPLCPVAIASSGVRASRAALALTDSAFCELRDERACPASMVTCSPRTARCVEGACVSLGVEEQAMSSAVDVPLQNEGRLAQPSPRPSVGDAEERARRLFDAIVNDDPLLAMDFFFPREVFLILKGIADPGRYYDRLLRRYVQDIHELHENTADLSEAEFLRFDLVRRGGWVEVREEGNRLPYWVSRHSYIYYQVGEEERRLEVRVLITWGERWYITHLSEFHSH